VKTGLWCCPKCGVKLVAKNLSHSCGDWSVDRFLEGKSASERALYLAFTAAIAACGPHDVAPAKTRVAFLAQVRFASVNRLSGETMDVHFVLPSALESERLRRVESVGKLFVHHVRITRVADIDDELRAWLAKSYVEYGERTWLARSTPHGRAERRRGAREAHVETATSRSRPARPRAQRLRRT
jgi:hypothetical protein